MKTASGIEITKLVIDASVAMKWFAEEEHTSKAEIIFNRILTGQISAFAPELLLYETGNALWKSKKFEQAKIIASLTSLFDSKMQLEPLDIILAHSAAALMIEYDLSFYDAVYLALARRLDIPLLTADLKYYQRVKGMKMIDLAMI